MHKIAFVFVSVLWLVLASPVVVAQDEPGGAYPIAPIQVEYNVENSFILFDCYPFRDGDASDLLVYLNRPDGTATYSCTLTSEIEIKPLTPPVGRLKYAAMQIHAAEDRHDN